MRQEFTATFTGTRKNYYSPYSTLASLSNLCDSNGEVLADTLSIHSGRWCIGLSQGDRISFRAELTKYNRRMFDGCEGTTVIETRLENIRKVRVK